MKSHNSTSFRQPSSFCSNNEVDICYILVPHGKCVDRDLPWFHLPAWLKFPWSSAKPFCHGRVSLTAIFATIMPLATLTVAQLLSHSYMFSNERTCSMKIQPVLPLHRKHRHQKKSLHSKRGLDSLTVWPSQIWINLENFVWQWNILTYVQKLFMLCSKSSSLPTDSSQLQKKNFSYTLSRFPGQSSEWTHMFQSKVFMVMLHTRFSIA